MEFKMIKELFVLYKLLIIVAMTFPSARSNDDDDDDSYNIPNVIRFPVGPVQGPFMGLFVAISLPLELPDYNVFFSYNFEANYNLPQNQSEFAYPPLVSRRAFDRKFVYDMLEFKMKSHGYPGRPCLLRAICEASQHSFKDSGVLADIFHLILTPSTSVNNNINNITTDYQHAEHQGRTRRNCRKYSKQCSISLLDLFSWVGKIL